jgi:hypothetical protein
LSIPVRAADQPPILSELARLRDAGLALGADPAPPDVGWVRASPPAAPRFERVFERPFVLVHGTGGRLAEDLALYERARHDQSVWWYRTGAFPRLLSDADFLTARDWSEVTRANVILYGNADTNAAWSRVVPSDHPIRAEDGAIQVGARRFEGWDLACLFTCPRADWKGPEPGLVGVFGDSGLSGTRLGLAWRPFVSGVSYPDWVVASTDALLADGPGWLASAPSSVPESR